MKCQGYHQAPISQVLSQAPSPQQPSATQDLVLESLCSKASRSRRQTMAQNHLQTAEDCLEFHDVTPTVQ